jgi:hypothetical protein
MPTLQGGDVMKRTYYFMLSLFVNIIGCDKTVAPLTEQSSLVTSISGKITNWNAHLKSGIALWDGSEPDADNILSYSSIDSNGKFILDNLKKPSDSMFLNPVYPRFADNTVIQESTFHCNDSTAQVVYGRISMVEQVSNRFQGDVYRTNMLDDYYLYPDRLKSGDILTQYLYVDKEVNLEGRIKYSFYDTLSKREGHYTLNYHLAYKIGWNRLVRYVVSQTVLKDTTKTVLTAEYNYINQEPAEAGWYIIP